MVLWDCVSLFDAEEEKDLRHEDSGNKCNDEKPRVD